MEEERREREITNLREECKLLRSQLTTISRLGARIPSTGGSELLQDVIDIACELTGARYGALGVFDDEGHVETFITHGITAEERRRIGPLPEGLGILGLINDLQRPLRLSDLTQHHRSVGFPPNHPAMKTFLGAPLRFEQETLGNIYLTEKAGGQEFTAEDEDLLVLFAAQAAMSIRNAQLSEQARAMAIVEERDRIGMDLHDGVIQALYGTGLRLESCAEDVGADDDAVRGQLQTAISELNQVIADVRSYVLHLRPDVLHDRTLAEALQEFLEHLTLNESLQARIETTPGACDGLDEGQMTGLYLIAHEALTNTRKHAAASDVVVHLQRQNGAFQMHIEDNGGGFDTTHVIQGDGLRNMRERAQQLGGTLSVMSKPGAGTCLEVEIPVDA